MAATAASEKRCYYEVLGLSRDCTTDEIRSAYKKLALQRHPDKLIKSGISEAEATSQFQELVHAYEVLSDPKERSWYDNHRSQVLFAKLASGSSKSNAFGPPDLYEYFSPSAYTGFGEGKRGFYRVYAEVFERVYACEIGFVRKMGLNVGVVKEMPVMGELGSGYDQVTAFYNYWLGFSTVMDFCWVDQYDVMAGVNRKSRRVMEEENKKLRKKARREYNDTVRKLAEFVKKRDKRVVDMTRKREEERVRKLEEEKERRKKAERERLERAKMYEEPEWTMVDEEGGELEDEEEEKKEDKKEFYCVVCGKKFKSEKQWKNHEQSKKHKEKVAELKESFADEDDEYQDVVDEFVGSDVKLNEDDVGAVDDDGDKVEELKERFKESVVVEDVMENDNVDKANMSNEEEEEEDDEEESYFDANDSIKAGGFSGLAGLTEDDDVNDETSVLETMVSGRKKKSADVRSKGKVCNNKIHVADNRGEFDSMEYNKKAPKNRKARRAKGKNKGREGMTVNEDGVSNQNEGTSHASNLHTEESTSHSRKEDETVFQEDDQFVNSNKTSSLAGDRKNASKKETNAKLKNSSKGKKTKASSKDTSNECEKCGQGFDSRNKLHKHLNETGHSSLKYK